MASIDGVLGAQTRVGKMVGANESMAARQWPIL